MHNYTAFALLGHLTSSVGSWESAEGSCHRVEVALVE